VTEVTAPGRLAALQPRNWNLPVKLVSVLLVPTLLALTLGALRIVDRTQEATALEALGRYLVLQDKTSQVISHLQEERHLGSMLAQNNGTGDSSAWRGTVDATDAALNDLTKSVGAPASLGGSPSAAFTQVKVNLVELEPLRQQIATGSGIDSAAVVARYTGVIEPLVVFEAALDRQLNTPPVSAGMAAGLSSLNVAREQVALQYAVVALAIARGEMLPGDADTVRASDARFNSAVDQLRAGLSAEEQARHGAFVTSPANDQRQQLKQAALSRVGGQGQLGVSAKDWNEAYDFVTEQMRRSETGLRGEIRATSAAAAQDARHWAGIEAVILLLTMLVSALVVYLISRLMLKPLRLLRRTAMDVAERRLPMAARNVRVGQPPSLAIDPVPVTSTEEIGQVARAFDAVHGQAVRLAAEQATLQTNVSGMFVNLSRRGQGLIERQLRLIEHLERNEQDDEQLANLFQLDHLATRMRRHSENLMVLAGGELTKPDTARMSVMDVLRAAVSEIEQYQRVVVRQSPSAGILGRAATDLVHLIAELLDNATNFSAQKTQVAVQSSCADNGSLLVEIVDHGVGMPGDALIAANNRLAEPIVVDTPASRRMGLFVVARLAARHAIEVRLASTDPARATSGGGGVTASVRVPSALIASGGRHASAPVTDAVEVDDLPALASAAAPATRSAGSPEPPEPPEPPPSADNNDDSPIFEEMTGWLREQTAGSPAESGAAEDDDAGHSHGDGTPAARPPNSAAVELTPAGLPKRRPRSNLIPRDPDGIDPAGAVPARSAEQVRGRLASYQRGIRQGRESRLGAAVARHGRHAERNTPEETP
jgi:signal transduction histidine kinase